MRIHINMFVYNGVCYSMLGESGLYEKPMRANTFSCAPLPFFVVLVLAAAAAARPEIEHFHAANVNKPYYMHIVNNFRVAFSLAFACMMRLPHSRFTMWTWNTVYG